MSFNSDDSFSAFRQTNLEGNTETGRAESESMETEWQLNKSGAQAQYFKQNQTENVSNFDLEIGSNFDLGSISNFDIGSLSNCDLGNITNPSFDLVPGLEEEFDRVLSQSLTPPDFYPVGSTSRPINEFLRSVKSQSNKFAETSFNQTTSFSEPTSNKTLINKTTFNETSFNQTTFNEATFDLSLEEQNSLDLNSWAFATSQDEENDGKNHSPSKTSNRLKQTLN